MIFYWLQASLLNSIRASTESYHVENEEIIEIFEYNLIAQRRHFTEKKLVQNRFKEKANKLRYMSSVEAH